MPFTEPINIYYSKKALGVGLVSALIVFLVGIGMMAVMKNGTLEFSIYPFSKWNALGIFLMIASVLLGNFYRKKLGETAPAIIVDEKGITINYQRHQFVSWGAIDHIEVHEVSTSNSNANKTKFLVPVLKDAETDKMDALDRSNVEINSTQPISIETTFLKCSFDELKDIFETWLTDYNSRTRR